MLKKLTPIFLVLALLLSSPANINAGGYFGLDLPPPPPSFVIVVGGQQVMTDEEFEDALDALGIDINDFRFSFVQGGAFFADFFGVPDFANVARISPIHINPLPTIAGPAFFYLGNESILYEFSSRIINYLDELEPIDLSRYGPMAENLRELNFLNNVTPDELARFKDMVVFLGFERFGGDPNNIRGGSDERFLSNHHVFDSFFEEIRQELFLDTEFVLDEDGIFYIENQQSFRLLLIGRSVAADPLDPDGLDLVESIQMRFYRLARVDGIFPDPLDIP